MRSNTRYLTLLVLAMSFVVLIFSFSDHNVYAVSYTLSGDSECTYSIQNGGLGGTWDTNVNSCTVNYLTLNSGDALTIGSGTTLQIHTAMSNSGTINNVGTLNINNGANLNNGGTINNSGVINNNGIIGYMGNGYIINTGTINNNHSGVFSSGRIDNNRGTINNSGGFHGYINNFCGGTSSGVSASSLNCAKISVTSSKSTSPFGQQVTFSASVLPPSATGNFTLYDGTSQLYSGSLVLGGTGTFSTSALVAGTHNIFATYSGDTNNGIDTSPIITQKIGRDRTTITIATSNPTTVYGQSVTFTATISPSDVTGLVQFNDQSTNPPTPLGNETTSSGQATFVISTLSVGMHSISATYSGDVNNEDSTSNIISQAVVPAQNPATSTPQPQQIQQPTPQIPHWVKSLFNLYGQGQVSDSDLISALKFLIQTGVIKLS